jgi:hypothetical protein
MWTRSAPEFGFGALRPRMRPRLVPALSAGTLPPQVIISIQRLQRALDRSEKGRFIVGPSLSNPSHGSGQMKAHPAAEVACPLAAIDQRLADAHRLWHQAEAAYFDPDGFRLAVQNAIQILRSVTFIAQNQKAVIPDFTEWYGDYVDEKHGKRGKWHRDEGHPARFRRPAARRTKGLFGEQNAVPVEIDRERRART